MKNMISGGAALFVLSGWVKVRSKTVNDTSKRSWGQAESIFTKARTQAMSLGRILSEQDAVSSARDAKTARLRELRLKKEAAELAAAPKTTGRR
jgi:hypothetical protein